MTLITKRPSREATRDRLVEDVREGGKRHRINVDVEDALYKQLKIRAVEEGRTVADITRDLWAKYLSK